MQTTVQNEKEIRLGSVIFEADFGNGRKNLGALREAVLTISKLTTNLTFDNAKASPRRKIQDLLLGASLYEFSLEKLRMIEGLGELSSLDGTETTGTQNIASVSANQSVELEFQNWDGSMIAAIDTATAGGTPFTDYELIQVDGKTYIKFATAKTDVVLEYKFTPLASQTLVFSDVIQAIDMHAFRFTNMNGEGKKLQITFPLGYSNNDSTELNFQADESTDDAMSYPVSIKAFPAKDQKLCTILDEQGVL